MDLVVLGSEGGWPRAGRAACGYLLRHEGFHVWLDAGTGTMANLQRHVALADVDAVVLSHRHFDHFVDVYPFVLARRYGDAPWPPVPLFAPPGLVAHAMQLEEELVSAFDVREVAPGEAFEVGPFAVETRPMRHPVPTLGLRLAAGGRALAYSADTGPTDDLAALAGGADALLCEATWGDREELAQPFHLLGREAGEHAAAAGTGRLVLTHIWPERDRERTAAAAAAAFDGPVELAEEGMVVSL